MENDKNKMEKLKMFATSPELAIFDMLDEVNEKLSAIKKVLEPMNLEEVDTIKGDKPEKGVDYFTDEDIESLQEMIKDEVTPVKGVHYFDGKSPDIEEIISEVMKRMKNNDNDME